MLKIGEFSKLSLTTVKALRFYEKEGILIPASVDEWTGYRFYETAQLDTAAMIKSYRQLGLSIEEIKSIFSGEDANKILSEKSRKPQKTQGRYRTSAFHHRIYLRRKRNEVSGNSKRTTGDDRLYIRNDSC